MSARVVRCRLYWVPHRGGASRGRRYSDRLVGVIIMAISLFCADSYRSSRRVEVEPARSRRRF